MARLIPKLLVHGFSNGTTERIVRAATESCADRIELATGRTFATFPDVEFAVINVRPIDQSKFEGTVALRCQMLGCKAVLPHQIFAGRDGYELQATEATMTTASLVRVLYHGLAHVLLYQFSPDPAVWRDPVRQAEERPPRDVVVVEGTDYEVARL